MDKYNLLKDFCQKGNIKAVDSILNDNPDLINGERNKDELSLLTPVSVALINHKLKMAQHLLDKGAEINQIFILDKIKTNLLNTLVELEAEVFYEQENSYPKKIYIKNLEFAVENNVVLNEYDEKGYTCLDIALKTDHYTGANYLHSIGVKHSRKMFNEFNFKDKKGNELKYYLKAYPYLNELNINDCIETKDSFLYPKELPSYHNEIYRTMNNHLTLLNNYPLKLGFIEDIFKDEPEMINQKDYLGRTALDYAIEIGHTLAVDYLRSIGGKTSDELKHTT